MFSHSVYELNRNWISFIKSKMLNARGQLANIEVTLWIRVGFMSWTSLE